MKHNLFLSVAWAAALCSAQSATVDVTAHGAIPNDGKDDQLAIQNAINTSAAGDVIYFPAGTYAIKGGLTFKSDRIYCGQSGAILSETGVQPGFFLAGTEWDNGKNITVTNLVFNGGGFGYSGSGNVKATNVNLVNCTFQNINFSGYPFDSAIYIPIGLKNSRISNNLFTNILGDNCIYCWKLGSVQVTDNWFDTINEGMHSGGNQSNVTIARNTGVHLHRMGIENQTDDDPNLLVEDNHFSHWSSPYPDSFGLSIIPASGTNKICRYNTVLARPQVPGNWTNRFGFGIECRDVTVCDNFVEGYWWQGIVNGGGTVLIANNVCRGPDGAGQYIDPTQITFEPGGNTNTTIITNNTRKATGTYIEPPARLTASAINSARVALSWIDSSSNETGFKVQRKVLGGAYAVIATLGANVTNYTDTTVAPATQYVYRIQPYNANDQTYSHVVLVTTPPDPGHVSIQGVDANGAHLIWSGPANGKFAIKSANIVTTNTWSALTTFTSTNTTRVFTDTAATNFKSRFYRAAVE